MIMGADRPVTLAAIVGAHGIRGEVRLKLFTATPEGLSAHRTFLVDGRSLTLLSLKPAGQGIVARFAEIADRTAAEALRGKRLTIPRAALPPLGPGEYYWHDLIDLPVVTNAGVAAGIVVAVDNFGASDVLEIARPDGRRFMVPMVESAVLDVGKHVVIDAEWAN